MEAQTELLIAEDDDEDFEIFKLALEDLEVSVLVTRAENGKILLQILDKHIPDILFLDILLPYIDGRQCLKEIRSNRKFDLLPIIIYSSVHDPNVIEFTFREGANIYTIKPSSFQELKLILKKVLSIEWKKSLYYPGLPDFVINQNQ